MSTTTSESDNYYNPFCTEHGVHHGEKASRMLPCVAKYAPAPATAQTAEHTPLPWDFAIYQGVAHITPDLGRYSLAKLESDNYDADARFIVKAVNNHAKLVAALREVRQMNQYIVELSDKARVENARQQATQAIKAIDAALADAQGEE